MDQAMADGRATVSASQSRVDQHPQIVSITWREGNKWAGLFGAQSWGDGSTCDAIETHCLTCQYLNVGVYATPSSLGQATIRARLAKWYTTMPLPCQNDLLNHLVGGRAELDSPGYYPIAYEIDRRMAYVAESTQCLPDGAPILIGEIGLSHVSEYPHWFGRCMVVNGTNLKRGPFPFRSSSGRLSFPTGPGIYTAWLWKEEASDAISSGCLVYPERVWAWERSVPALRDWAEWIYAKRMNAPTPEVAAYVKRVAVAGLGWFAMRGQRLRVRWSTDSESERVIVNGDGWPTAYVAVPDPDAQPSPIMPHWASYIWMQARRTLYAEMVSLQDRGVKAIASDFDSIITTLPTGYASEAASIGEWRERTLTEVSLSVPRHLVSAEKVKRPGVSR